MRGNRGIEKPTNFKQSIKDLLNYNKNFIFLIVIALLLSMTSSIMAIIGPDKLKEITNIITSGLMTGIDMSSLKKVALFLLVIYLISLVFDYIQGFIMAIVTNKFSKRMRGDIASKIN